jgi:hypothetical protein
VLLKVTEKDVFPHVKEKNQGEASSSKKNIVKLIFSW